MDVGLTPIMLSKISKTKTWTSVLRISMLASTRRSCLDFILDPRAPPPNVYVIPDLMGSTMAPHTAHVNWRPFTPERKFQFKIIYNFEMYCICEESLSSDKEFPYFATSSVWLSQEFHIVASRSKGRLNVVQ